MTHIIIHKSGIVAIEEGNVISLLSREESKRFLGIYDMMRHLKKTGAEAFFANKIERLCGMFMGSAA